MSINPQEFQATLLELGKELEQLHSDKAVRIIFESDLSKKLTKINNVVQYADSTLIVGVNVSSNSLSSLRFVRFEDETFIDDVLVELRLNVN